MDHKGFYRALKYIVYLTQLGLSMVVPIFLCIFIGNWLQEKLSLGSWIIFVFIILGVGSAFLTFYRTMQITILKPEKRTRDEEEEE